MGMKYFMIVNGQQMGPFDRHELRGQGLAPDTYVWREGMAEWKSASSLPELSDLFMETTTFAQQPQQPQSQAPGYQQPYASQQMQQPYNQPQQPQPQYNQPQQPGYQQPYGQVQQPSGYQQPYGQPSYGQDSFNRTNIPHTNWMVWAIIGTILGLFCSCLLGTVFGIIGIVKASNANKAYAMGDQMTGDSYNSGAKIWTLVSLITSAVGFVFYIIYWIALGSIFMYPF